MTDSEGSGSYHIKKKIPERVRRRNSYIPRSTIDSQISVDQTPIPGSPIPVDIPIVSELTQYDIGQLVSPEFSPEFIDNFDGVHLTGGFFLYYVRRQNSNGKPAELKVARTLILDSVDFVKTISESIDYLVEHGTQFGTKDFDIKKAKTSFDEELAVNVSRVERSFNKIAEIYNLNLCHVLNNGIVIKSNYSDEEQTRLIEKEYEMLDIIQGSSIVVPYVLSVALLYNGTGILNSLRDCLTSDFHSEVKAYQESRRGIPKGKNNDFLSGNWDLLTLKRGLDFLKSDDAKSQLNDDFDYAFGETPLILTYNVLLD